MRRRRFYWSIFFVKAAKDKEHWKATRIFLHFIDDFVVRMRYLAGHTGGESHPDNIQPSWLQILWDTEVMGR